MNSGELDRAHWQAYFDHMSRQMEGKRAEVEIDAQAFGVQVEAEWLPLFGVVYESKTDTLEFALEGLVHRIHHPQTVYVEQPAMSLVSMEVIDADGVRHILRLRDPLLLPAPPGMAAAPGSELGNIRPRP